MGDSVPPAYLDLFDRKAFRYLATLTKDGPQVTPVWVDHDGGYGRFNFALDRVKDQNVRSDPCVPISIQDPDNLFLYMQLRSRVVQIARESADDYISKLLQNILTHRSTPSGRPVARGSLTKVEPQRVQRMGQLGSWQRDVDKLRAMAYQTKTVITTNGKRYALVVHGDGTIEVCADMLHAPPFCKVGNLADALDVIRWHSGGDIKDLY